MGSVLDEIPELVWMATIVQPSHDLKQGNAVNTIGKSSKVCKNALLSKHCKNSSVDYFQLYKKAEMCHWLKVICNVISQKQFT